MRKRIVRYDQVITARLSQSQVAGLLAVADRERRPVSELLRDAIDNFLDGEDVVANEAIAG